MAVSRDEKADLALAELIRGLQDQPIAEVPGALLELAVSAVEAVPGAEYCGITIADHDGVVESFAATHAYASLLDEIQQTRGEGPCLTAAWEHHTIRVNDLANDHRWPAYRQDVLEKTPIKAILSFELFTGQKKLRALNFYSERANAFDELSIEVGLTYATHIAIAWNILLRDEQFRSALASRDIIGQAKGIIMERFDVDAGHAFELLRRLSQGSNVPLAQVADRLVATRHSDVDQDERPTGRR